jgi:hypothetical protein
MHVNRNLRCVGRMGADSIDILPVLHGIEKTDPSRALSSNMWEFRPTGGSVCQFHAGTHYIKGTARHMSRAPIELVSTCIRDVKVRNALHSITQSHSATIVETNRSGDLQAVPFRDCDLCRGTPRPGPPFLLAC